MDQMQQTMDYKIFLTAYNNWWMEHMLTLSLLNVICGQIQEVDNTQRLVLIIGSKSAGLEQVTTSYFFNREDHMELHCSGLRSKPIALKFAEMSFQLGFRLFPSFSS